MGNVSDFFGGGGGLSAFQLANPKLFNKYMTQSISHYFDHNTTATVVSVRERGVILPARSA
ncbi:MAG: hypothetical protein H6887_14985 [Hoeflea sp.]|nr:hypothetical protein [Hoeflea sp.]